MKSMIVKLMHRMRAILLLVIFLASPIGALASSIFGAEACGCCAVMCPLNPEHHGGHNAGDATAGSHHSVKKCSCEMSAPAQPAAIHVTGLAVFWIQTDFPLPRIENSLFVSFPRSHLSSLAAPPTQPPRSSIA